MNMTITLIILAASLVLFVLGTIRPDLVALCSLVALTLCSVITPQEAFSGFSNPVIVMMVGVFVVSGGIFRTGLTEIVSRKILVLAGTSQLRVYLLVMLVTAFIGAFVSNTGTVALMLPIVVSMAAAAGTNPRQLLMPLAFMSSMGGMLTLIGTAPNLVISNTLQEGGFGALSFFSFFPVGVACVLLGIAAMYPLGKLLVAASAGKKETKERANKSLRDLAREYQLTQHIFRVRVPISSPLAAKTLLELELPQRYALSVSEIRREEEHGFLKSAEQQNLAEHNTLIKPGDILHVVGSFDMARRFAEENGATLLEAEDAPQSKTASRDLLRFDTIGIAEVVLLSTSRLVNASVRDSRFREKYNCSVLGLQRENKYVLQGIAEEKLRAGDLLLVQGKWTDIARLSEERNDWVVVGQPLVEASKLTLDRKAPLAAAILIAMVATMAFNMVSAAIAVLLAALAMVFSGCFRNAEEAYKVINWESIVLVAAMLPMSIAVEKTGISSLISQTIAQQLGAFGPFVVLGAIYFATSLLTLFISNTATAVLFAPIAMQAALSLKLNPHPFLFAVTVAASMCFASPFSTAPNALVMSAGRYTFMDYVKVGLPLQILFGVVMTFLLPRIFPF